MQPPQYTGFSPILPAPHPHPQLEYTPTGHSQPFQAPASTSSSALPSPDLNPQQSKKRARKESTNGGTMATSPGIDAGDDGDDEETKARKRRLALSCKACRNRKIKCDRKQPCSSCIRRKVAASCSWDDDDPDSNSFALNSDVRQLARRLAHLESLFQATNPGLLPKELSGSVHHSPTGEHSISGFSPNSPHRHEGTGGNGGDDDFNMKQESDTEEAAVTLEDVAFGARVPVLKAINAASRSNSKRLNSSRHAKMELTSALTSIIIDPLLPDQDGRARSAVRLGLDLAVSTADLPTVRSNSMAQIFAVLPGKEIADFLVQKYFTEMEWDFQPLDAESFIPEHERYCQMLLEGREDSIDPLWVAVFCMVLALSLEGFWTRVNGAKNVALFRGLSERELQDLPSVWHDAALRALQIGEWGGTPRIRTVQCIILFGQYIQISSSSGQQGRFLGWAAAGIRVAQRLGLHRLGSNPEIMPPDDPALPPGKNSVKRETAVRLFNILVVIDSILSDSPQFRCYTLNPLHCAAKRFATDRAVTHAIVSTGNTARPSNLNLTDLSRTEWKTITPPPASVLTTSSYEIAQGDSAAQIRRSLDILVLGTAPFSYTRVLEQDREWRKLFEALPDRFSERAPPLDSDQLRYQRALIHGEIYARLVRLHRPFLSRGYNQGSQFRYSMEQCTRAARLSITCNSDLLRLSNSLWSMYTSTLGSAIVLFMDLFHAIDSDLPEHEIVSRREVLVKASIIFATQVHSPALRAVVEQGRKILHGLFQAEENRRLNKRPGVVSPAGSFHRHDSFAHVLQGISQNIALEEQESVNPGYASSVSSTASGVVGAGPTSLAPPVNFDPRQPSPLSQDMTSTFDYQWPDGLGSNPPDDFTHFFETLASEDWAAAFAGSDTSESSGLLGQMAATW